MVVLLGYLSVTAINILNAFKDPLRIGASLACLTLVFVIQLRHSSPTARRAPLRRQAFTLGAQAVLTYLPLIVFKSSWGAMAGFLAGSLLLLLPPRLAWPAYGAVGLSMLLPPAMDSLPVSESFYLCQSTLVTGLVVFGLSRLSELIRALHDTRVELSRMAVDRERLRFARDLHDVLGYSLSAITLKTQLIQRLIPNQPKRALAEVADVLETSRQSLADVRAVASGLRGMSLEQELGSAESLLSAAEVRVVTDIRIDDISDRTGSVLAAVLREAVTNLLRHSQATRCTIKAVQDKEVVRLSVANDGVDPGYRDPSPHGGSGLGNLATRMAAVSGTLVTRRGPDGTFELTAEAPVRHIRSVAQPGDGEALQAEGPAA